jgi:RNA polymerase sigma-70 factor (ECF subfamily)
MGASLDELEAAYRSSLPRFRRVAAAILGDRERACDAVQDAFAKAIRKRRSYRGSGPLDAWLWRLVVNEARGQARPFEPLPEELLAQRDIRTNGGADARDELRVAVALLPERQRLVLFLRYYADLDYAAIADALEIAPGTVAATLNAAHATLHRTLQEVAR